MSTPRSSGYLRTKSAANNLPLLFSLERGIGQFFIAPRDLDDDATYRSNEPFR